MPSTRAFKPGDIVEADARRVLGQLDGHRLFPDDPALRLRGALVRRVPGARQGDRRLDHGSP